MTIDGVPVIDGVIHPYNLSEDNTNGQIGPMVREGFYQLHSHWNPPELQAPRSWFQTDQSVSTLMDTLCLESSVDIAVYDTLRLDSLFHDGLAAAPRRSNCASNIPVARSCTRGSIRRSASNAPSTTSTNNSPRRPMQSA